MNIMFDKENAYINNVFVPDSILLIFFTRKTSKATDVACPLLLFEFVILIWKRERTNREVSIMEMINFEIVKELEGP